MRAPAHLLRALILMLLAAPAGAAPAGEAPPPQPPARPLSATVRLEPDTLVEGAAVRFHCLLRNTSATPVAVLGMELDSTMPGLSREWTFTAPVRADGAGRDGGVLRLVRQRLESGALTGARDTGTCEAKQVVAPGAALQVAFSAQALPAVSPLLDATLSVRWLPTDAIPLAWSPLPAAPSGPPGRVVQEAREVDPAGLTSGMLIPSEALAAAKVSDYRILAPVAPGDASLKAALAKAGVQPRDVVDAAWIPEARTWALEAERGERTFVVMDGEVFQVPGRLASWLREIALGEREAEVRVEGRPRPELARLLRDLPRGGSGSWRVPVARLPRLLLDLQRAGWVVTPEGRIEQP